MKGALITVTLIEVGLLVIVLVTYLVAIAGTLRKISSTLGLVTFGVPQTTSSFTATNRMAAIYLGQAYDPAQSGALTTLNFSADVRPFSNSFAFGGTNAVLAFKAM